VPDCIKQLYNITYTPPSTPPSPVRLGIAGFLEQWVLYSDVAEFLGRYAPSLLGSSTTTTNTTTPSSAAANFTIEPLNNGTNPQSPPSVAGLEASLDVQYALALGYPAQVTYYSTGGRGIKLDPATGRPVGSGSNGSDGSDDDSSGDGSSGGGGDSSAANDNEPYLEFLTALLARPDDALPHVLSISYADDEASVPRAYARRVCDLFAALAARGVSVLVATGDGGAAGTGQTQCVVAASAAAAGGGGVDDEGTTKRFVPTFPGSCPYVTAVGATDNVGPPVAGAVFSAGGFSDVFARPAWQEGAVAAYVAGLAANASDARLALFNASGRATPDISAIGAGFQIVMGGSVTQVLGTSASTPVVAAMVALVNDARMRAGKPSLGWLNPLLYADKVRAVLRDVQAGTSAGCRFPDGSTAPGWTAVAGYDCVTGLGVVGDFNAFLASLM
jgi:tripeptidyl-peptidase-1